MKKTGDIINIRKSCAVCGNLHLDEILALPHLPLTGIFTSRRPSGTDRGIDQQFLWCPRCGHGQLARQIDPAILYDSKNYTFRTSASATAMERTQVSINFIKKIFPKRKFACAVDVGCNDLYLLKELKGLARIRVGIDPIWSSQELSAQGGGLYVLGKQVEQVNFSRDLPVKPDLILCFHTIEHIYEPQALLEKLIREASDDAVFIFEMPGLTALLERGRFDQIFHEHLQYFSPASMEYLITKLGGEVIAFGENYHHWGAMQVAFRKKSNAKQKCIFPFRRKDILAKIDLFRQEMGNTRRVIMDHKGRKYGYGAAMMVPVLAYHLGVDLDLFEGIIDDDPQKAGKFYVNLSIPIIHSSKVKNFSQHMVLITALDNIVPIMRKLLAARPKQIVYPFHSI